MCRVSPARWKRAVMLWSADQCLEGVECFFWGDEGHASALAMGARADLVAWCAGELLLMGEGDGVWGRGGPEGLSGAAFEEEDGESECAGDVHGSGIDGDDGGGLGEGVSPFLDGSAWVDMGEAFWGFVGTAEGDGVVSGVVEFLLEGGPMGGGPLFAEPRGHGEERDEGSGWGLRGGEEA